MKRKFLTLAIGVALSALIATGHQQTLAQQSGNASTQSNSAQGNAQQDQSKDQGTADREQSDRQQTDSQQTNQQQSARQDDSRSASDNAGTAQRDAQSTTSQDQQTDRQSTTGASDRQRTDQSLLTQPEGRNQLDRDSRRTDSRDQGRGDANRQSRDNLQTDMQRGIRFDRSGRSLAIRDVERDSFFFRSGFRSGDVIVSINNRPIRDEDDFRRFLVVRSGQRVPVVVLRNGVRDTVYLEPSQGLAPQDQAYDNRQPQAGGQAVLGVTFDPRARAAVVRSVTPGGPAEQAGLQPGDVIVGLNREPVRTDRDVISIVRSMQPGDRLTISFERQLETEAILGGQPGEPVHTAAYPPDVQSDQQSTAPPQDRRTDIDRRDRSDERGILNRNRNNNNRPLRPRLLD
jgi:C-terminal processing protease CtpA/Prc